MHMAYRTPHPQTPTPDQWKQHRQPLDPTSLPSSPFSPSFSPASSPRTPRGSPTVARQLNKFGDLSLNNGQSTSSGISTGSPIHRSLFDESNDTSDVENLGPSFTRRTPTDNFQRASGSTAPHYMSTVRYRGDRPTLSRLPVPPMPLPEDLPYSAAELDVLFDVFRSTPTDIAIFTDTSTASVGLPIQNDDPFVFPLAGSPSHSHAVSQFGAPLLPLSSTGPHALTGPHEVHSDYYSHRAPSDPAASVEGCSGFKQSESKGLWNYYHKNFKRSQPLVQACEHRLKEKVGSIKTCRASLKKRKDEARWVCPVEGNNFTRKQNLKLHIQSHLGLRDHRCICGTTFNALSGLKRHQKKCLHAALTTNQAA